MTTATEQGKRVSYVYRDPESGGLGADHTGALEYQQVWSVKRNGPVFGSGWHKDESEG